ncbi:MAG: hypothetical protein ABIN69_12380, partial [Aestuariivirga sp.]
KWNWTNISTSLPFSPNDRPEAPLELMQRRERVIVIDTYMPILGLLPWLRKSHPLRGCTAQQTVSYLVKRYLSPKQHILDECMKFWHEQFDQKPFHCIHLRGLDKGVEAANFEELNQQCISNLDEADQSLPILVLTDDANIYREMSSRYGSRAIFTSSTRGSGKTGIHLLEGAKGQSLGQEIMFDSYLATFADRFFGVASSNVATMISYLKDWPQGHCTLVGSSALTSLSIFSGYISAKAAVISALPMPLQGNIWKLAED